MDLRVMHTTTAFAANPLNWAFDGLDCPFTLGCALGCLPSSLYTFLLPGLARDYRATGFPDFDRYTHKDLSLCCPV